MRDAPLTPPPCPSLLLCAPSQLTHVTLSTRSVPHLCSVLALAGHNLRIPFTCQARGQKHIAYYEPGQPTPSASESGPGLTRARPPGRPSRPRASSCAPPLVNYGYHRTTETRRCFRSHWLRATLHGGGGGCRSPCSLSGRGHPRSGQEGSLQPRSEQTRLVGACEMKATATQTHKVQICRQLSSQIMQKG